MVVSVLARAGYGITERLNRLSLSSQNNHPQRNKQMKEEQKRQDSLEYLKAYIARHCGRMTPEQISEELQVPLFAVKMHWPNPAR